MRRAAAVLAALTLTLTLGACTGVAGTGGKGYVSGDGTIVRLDPADRGKPIELTGDTLEGEKVDLATFRGKPVVVNVWWSNCPPCRSESPKLVSAHTQIAQKATFLGINTRDGSVDGPKAFERKHEITWPSLFSPDGTALLPFAKTGLLNPSTIPSTVILDAEGRVAASISGEVTSSTTLADLVDDVAAGK